MQPTLQAYKVNQAVPTVQRHGGRNLSVGVCVRDNISETNQAQYMRCDLTLLVLVCACMCFKFLTVL